MFSIILMALATGIVSGLMFGEYCADLKIVGDAYVGLLQMTVLPYIVFSLIASIGRLSLGEGKRLAINSVSILLVLWFIGAVTVVLIPLSLPQWNSGAFFSTSLLESQRSVDFISLFIPSNPFNSLANNFAPAVVLFCILFGVALINVDEKEHVLKNFDVFTTTLSRVNSFIVKLSPIGIFAISASATGTLTLEEFGRLQAYLLTFTLSVLLLTLWVLPMLIASCTPFAYKDILAVSKSVLVMAFVIGSLFAVIPLLIQGVRELIEKYQREGLLKSAHPEFIIPLAYPFPDLGKLLTLLFIPFAAWFYGDLMTLGEYPLLLATGMFLSFGKVTNTIPFLLEMQELPADIFQLFLMSSVVAGRVSDMMGGMHLMAFTALTTCAMSGLFQIKRLKLFISFAVTLILGALIILGTRTLLEVSFKDTYRKDKVIAGMHLMQPRVPTEVLGFGEPNPIPLLPGQSRLERTQQRGVIRIGFRQDNLPFSYSNTHGELVGFDIDMAHRLARDLEVGIEFVPFAVATLSEQLAEDHFDIAVSGIAATVKGARSMFFSESYMDVIMALAIRDHDKDRFSDLASIQRLGSVSVGVEIGSYFAETIQDYLPQAKLVMLWSESLFFEGPPQHMDALVTSAEGGSAWTLIYPEYTVVNPLPDTVSVPLVYPLGGRDPELEKFLDQWIVLKSKDGTIKQLYDHWILGRGAQVDRPRWSVIRDVLHWVE
ncbi:MAG: cation:dicarboxylase symporter family transporter [Gammaproteobacteria bacterium]|nr:cation:dicarboxylase symporter family transporter [Gammaproteobacteria bacterium]